MAMRRRLVLVGLLATAMLLVTGLGTVSAQTPGDMAFQLDLVIEENGEWALPSVAGLELGLTSRNFTALSEMLNLGIAPPVIDPQVISMAMEYDIQTLSLLKEGTRTSLMVNGLPLTAVTLAEPALAVINDFTPGLEGIVAGLSRSNVMVNVTFPAGPGAMLTSSVGALGVAETQPLNVIDVAMTVSPEGRLHSVGNVPLQPMGLEVALGLDLAVLDQFGITELGTEINGQHASIIANREEWLRVEWNLDFIKERAPSIYQNVVGAPLSAQEMQILDVATSWLKDTQINVAAYVSDEAMDGLPRVHIGRPILVDLSDDNMVVVEGIATGVALGADLSPYRDTLRTLSVSWDGGRGKLSPSVNGKALPYLQMEKDFVMAATNALALSDPLIETGLDALMQVDFTIASTLAAGVTPDMTPADYAIKPVTRHLALVPTVQVSRTDGSIAVAGMTLPLGLVESLSGMEIMQPVRQQAQAYSGVSSLGFSVGPNGIKAQVNGSGMVIGWDATLRNNLVDLAGEMFLKDVDLTAVGATGFVGNVLTSAKGMVDNLEIELVRGAVALITQMEFGVELELQDEALPSTLLDLASLPMLVSDPVGAVASLSAQ